MEEMGKLFFVLFCLYLRKRKIINICMFFYKTTSEQFGDYFIKI